MPSGIYKRTKEYREKMSKAMEGHPNYNFNIYERTEEHKKKMSEIGKGKKLSKKHKKKLSIARKRYFNNGGLPPMGMLGKKHTEKWRKEHSERMRGNKSPFWKGGITLKHLIIRKSFEYKLWRESVFKRDNWTCKTCGQIGGKLQVHHILSFSQYPEYRFNTSNGITLCRKCHFKTDNYGGKMEFLNKQLAKVKGREAIAEQKWQS